MDKQHVGRHTYLLEFSRDLETLPVIMCPRRVALAITRMPCCKERGFTFGVGVDRTSEVGREEETGCRELALLTAMEIDMRCVR
jgi:hypothetical protein